MYNTKVVLLKCQMPIVVLIYCTKYQSALQNSGVHNSSEDSIAQMPRQSNNINRLLLSAFRKGGGDEKIHQDLTLMMMMMMTKAMMMMMMMMVMLAWEWEGAKCGESLYWIKATLSICLHQPSHRFWARAGERNGVGKCFLS